jgi:germination protein M
MRKKTWFALSLLVLAMLFSGCSFWQKDSVTPAPPAGEDRPPAAVGMRETVFYFPNQDFEYLVPLRFSIPWEEGIARATINRLIDGQVPREIAELGFSPLLPAGTEIRGLTVRDGLARIDFNRTMLATAAERERLLLDGLVYTLTEFPTISRVEILVEGERISALNGGEPQGGYLDRGRGINLAVAGDVSDLTRTDRVSIYFVHITGKKTFYVPVTKIIKPTEDKIAAHAAELLRGPSAGSKLYSAIPRGINLDNITISGSRVTLHLSGQLAATGGGQTAADQIQDQLALTMTEPANIREVEILADGRTPSFAGGVTFPAVFGRPKSWNRVEPAPPPAAR